MLVAVRSKAADSLSKVLPIHFTCQQKCLNCHVVFGVVGRWQPEGHTAATPTSDIKCFVIQSKQRHCMSSIHIFFFFFLLRVDQEQRGTNSKSCGRRCYYVILLKGFCFDPQFELSQQSVTPLTGWRGKNVCLKRYYIECKNIHYHMQWHSIADILRCLWCAL